MLLKRGAEASLYLEDWHNRKVIMKRRLRKKYRLPRIDRKIRTQRTVQEPTNIHRAKEAGVPTPTIFMVDIEEANIIMEFIDGKQMKEVFDSLSPKKRKSLCRHIGELIGRLHSHRIIHGDLTTSNMILTPDRRIIFVDFGLSERSTEMEARGVDLHLMKRAFQSTHYKYAQESFEAIMVGYAEVMGKKSTQKILEKIQEIEGRGRYIPREAR